MASQCSSEETWKMTEESGTASTIAIRTTSPLGKVAFLGGTRVTSGATGLAWSDVHGYGTRYATSEDGVILKVDHPLIPFHDKYSEVKKEGNQLTSNTRIVSSSSDLSARSFDAAKSINSEDVFPHQLATTFIALLF
ncbi:hypothetical protein BDQ17DRAFT_1431230 [Cyathus striatus]|nr:hypothetical protein BDQ17DRAFT_1431230 [Cyathus striatus]